MSLLPSTAAKGNIFNTDLEGLVTRECTIPHEIEQILRYLERFGADTKDLFYVADYHYFIQPTKAKKKELIKDEVYKTRVLKIKSIKKPLMKTPHHIDVGNELEVIDDRHVAAGLLKLFLYKLKNPLLTHQLYHKFVNILSQSSVVSRIISMRSLLLSLSDARMNLLKRLISHFQVLLEPERVANNGLSPGRIAAVFGPLFLRRDDNEKQFHDSAAYATSVVTVVEMLIVHAQDIFEVSNEEQVELLLEQNRYLEEEMERMKTRQQQLEKKLMLAERGKHRAIILKLLEKRLYKCFHDWRHTVRMLKYERTLGAISFQPASPTKEPLQSPRRHSCLSIGEYHPKINSIDSSHIQRRYSCQQVSAQKTPNFKIRFV